MDERMKSLTWLRGEVLVRMSVGYRVSPSPLVLAVLNGGLRWFSGI